MAAIEFTLNNLNISLSGVSGYMEYCTYTNLDPVDYVFKSEHKASGEITLYRFHANTTEPAVLEGFRRQKTDESMLSFLGATMPGA